MNTAWKNRLQEYCQKNNIPLPNYRIKNQSGPAHILKFQVEVEIDGHWYVGDDLCSSKKEAEQSAAKKAWESILDRNESSISTPPSSQISTVTISDEFSEMPPSYSQIELADSKNHLPNQYADIENYIGTQVGAFNGRIRKISPPDSKGRYKFDITGSYRYCENIKRHHKKNQIYFIVNPIKRTYFQKCYDPECYGFHSRLNYIPKKQAILRNSEEMISMDKCSHCQKSLMNKKKSECERCGEIFCINCVNFCELCHDAVHCERCFELCFDCHDS
ncbi:unnamed protein product [Rotaria sordida]|uniref:DNA-directed primase/polymerase protein n=1 Tax=Rotaria sordida TaxID=392033 RepID=A0A819PYY6_9BILA|nr:unnamed protein product [Rotaria sordida]CAF1427217.1 unnamed protein product [Rotaria sordida]CAF4022431.1 unnamed protein product [Rotaria sordida]CAF4025856.1 unnamed protein product [Rotaria sordida]